MQHFDILIVGAGHAGSQAAIALRQQGFAGSIGIVGDEPELPYERPPLSKDYLAGDKPFERLLIRPASFWTERGIALMPGRRVVAVDPDAHRVTCAGGTAIGYCSLIWAAGGAARRLACVGGDLTGVHTIRTRADVDALVASLPDVTRVVVIGGGYIGLEAAAVLTGLGKQVTLIEAQDRVLARVAGEPLSRFYEGEHRAHGVDIRLNATVAALEGDGTVRAVRLDDGTLLPAEAVVVGIGIDPVVGPLVAAGAVPAADAGGVAVDAAGRTSLADIHAIGDCAAQANRFAGDRVVRIESVQNANDQANAVARALTGQLPAQAAVAAAVPWFWSNQYDLKLQTVGLSQGHDAIVVRGDPAVRSFSLIYLKGGRVIALDCVNSVKDYVQGRALVAAGATIDPAALADVDRPLKELAADGSPQQKRGG